MSLSHIITQSVNTGSRSLSEVFTKSAGAQQSIAEAVADSSTDLEIAFTLDVSECVSFYMVSDQDITVETNDGSSPDDTISLTAGVPYMWNEDSPDDFLLTVDVTALFITNASGSTANLDIEAIYDPTP